MRNIYAIFPSSLTGFKCSLTNFYNTLTRSVKCNLCAIILQQKSGSHPYVEYTNLFKCVYKTTVKPDSHSIHANDLIGDSTPCNNMIVIKLMQMIKLHFIWSSMKRSTGVKNPFIHMGIYWKFISIGSVFRNKSQKVYISRTTISTSLGIPTLESLNLFFSLWHLLMKCPSFSQP